jgi:hypothetical protein
VRDPISPRRHIGRPQGGLLHDHDKRTLCATRPRLTGAGQKHGELGPSDHDICCEASAEAAGEWRTTGTQIVQRTPSRPYSKLVLAPSW